MIVYSNNGLTFQSHPAGYEPQTGEVAFDDLATAAELTSAFPGYAAAVAAQKDISDKAPLQAQLAALDMFLPRGTEDVIAALVAKGTIALTDLPAVQQSRLAQKQALRAQLAATT